MPNWHNEKPAMEVYETCQCFPVKGEGGLLCIFTRVNLFKSCHGQKPKTDPPRELPGPCKAFTLP